MQPRSGQASSPSLSSSATQYEQPRHNIPAQLTPFIGREHEIQQLGAFIADENLRLITILGMGGMGKTRLAQMVATQHIYDFYDGVFFVSLVGLHREDEIPNAIAEALGIQFSSDHDTLQQVISYLQFKDILLILDNFEHLLDGVSILRQVLTESTQLKILVTSRQRLWLQGEMTLNLSGMRTQQWKTPAEALEADVVQLFVQSVQRTVAHFTVDTQNVAQVTRICNLLQGMPLGIELVASWVEAFTLSEIIVGIESRMDFLETNYHDVPDRHRNIHMILGQSLDLLPESDYAVFIRLCLFQGGFTYEAGRVVTGATVQNVASLVSKSLLQKTQSGRYTIHELLRQFGEKALQNNTRAYTETRKRHVQYYNQFLKERVQALGFGDPKPVCREISQEMSNIQTSWAWICEQHLFDEMVDHMTALLYFLQYENRFVEAHKLYQMAIDALQPLPPTPERDFALSFMLNWQGYNLIRFGRLDEVLAYCQQAWELYADNPVKTGRLHSEDPRILMTLCYAVMGRIEEGREIGLAVLDACFKLGFKHNIGLTCHSLTALELSAGNYEKVREYGIMGSKANDAVNHAYVQSYILNNWGNAELAMGNLDAARRLFTQSYEKQKFVGASEGMATALSQIAKIDLIQGKVGEARAIYEENLKIYRTVADAGRMVSTLDDLAQIAIRQKDYQKAADYLLEGLRSVSASMKAVSVQLLLSSAQLFLINKKQDTAIPLLVLIEQTKHLNPTSQKRLDDLKKKSAMDEIDPVEYTTLQDGLEQVIHDLQYYDWSSHQPEQVVEILSEREVEILKAVATGASNKAIAEAQFITVGTVKWYLNQIYSKFQVKNRIEAVEIAREKGIIP